MEFRQLGRSGLRVSTITLGTMGFGGRGQFADVGENGVEQARRQVDQALDAGVNLVDTADVYSSGASEEIVGEVLEGRYDRTLIASKVRFPMGGGPNDAGLSRHHIVQGCEASLRRLRTDHLDLYQVHEIDGLTPVDETLSALDDLVRAGKVRYVGASNYSGWRLAQALGVAEAHHHEAFASQQIYWSLQERSAEYELVPLAGGLLSGKYSRGADGGVEGPSGSRHLSDWSEPPINHPDRLWATVDVIREVADAHGVSGAQVALAWMLTRPAVTSLVIGARTPEQLADNLAAAELTLTGDEVDRLERVSRPELIYPYWHQAASASDRLSPADLTLLGRHLDGA